MYPICGYNKKYGVANRGRGSHHHLGPHYNRTFDYGSVVMEAMKNFRVGYQPISWQQILAFAEEHYLIKAEPDLSNLIQALMELQNMDILRSVGNQIFMETSVFRERYKNVFQITMPTELFNPEFGNRNDSGIVESDIDCPTARPSPVSTPVSVPTPNCETYQSKRYPTHQRFGSGRFKQ